MISINELKTITERVNYILASNPAARDSDNKLYADYILTFRPDLSNVPAFMFFNNTDLDIPTFESVRRVRAKLQAKHPELRGSVWCLQGRKRAEEVYKEYVKE